MAQVRLDGTGAGPGQPTRLDLSGEAHRLRLQPGHSLDIPGSAAGRARGDPRPGERRAQGWEAMDRLFAEQGDLAVARRGQWAAFSGRETRGRGVGGPATLEAPRSTGPGPGAQAPTAAWAEGAARLEEWARANGPRIGLETALRLPATADLAAARGPQAAPGAGARRPFRVG